MKKETLTSRLPLYPCPSPARWLGVMGGGQLGRMFVHAAQKMGFRVAVLEPALDCPAAHAADKLLCAAYADENSLDELAAQCAAVTTEFENVAAQSLEHLAEKTFVAPSAQCVAIAQDRLAEKRFLTECAATSGVFPAAHAAICTEADIDTVPDTLFPGILKTTRLGYDGKGQVRVTTRKALREAFVAMQGVACVFEKMLPLACEISVLAARGVDGHSVVYPIAENVHREGILFSTTAPAPNVSKEVADRAQAATLTAIEKLDYVGVLCIEFFVLTDGALVVNEMAPRPHNSGHYTIDACVTSQFAQQVRTMARLPLGEVRQHSPAVMLNLLGDIWFSPDAKESDDALPCTPKWSDILAIAGANLHLYGKDAPRRGRKMGHITFVAPTLEKAQENLRKACTILRIAP